MPKNVGFYTKYTITHNDGKPVDSNEKFLVISLTNPDAREAYAVSAFATMCRITGYMELGADLLNLLFPAYAPINQSRYVIWDGLKLGPFSEGVAKQLVLELHAAGKFAMLGGGLE